MSEHEKRLREWIAARRELSAAMKTTLAREVDASLSAARDAALEEAARDIDRRADYALTCESDREMFNAHDAAAKSIRALKSRPAERYIPESKVREILLARLDGKVPDHIQDGDIPGYVSGANEQVRIIARLLGVDLDATGGETDHPRTWGTAEQSQALRDGKPLEWKGETASEENGLLPRARLCQDCGHAAHGAVACMASYEGPAGTDVACLCMSDGSGKVKP